ncbi:MAG: dihydrodipicolinate synthase family protein [Nitrospirae bacterium]|nr:dihydrodipicolinate synthase family protein [Nitrospirota bacterium]
MVPTPLKEDYSVDESALAAVIEFLIRRRVHGITVLGSNGEFTYFTFEEKGRILRAAVRAAKGRVRILAGTGAMGTEETLALTRMAKDVGADGALVALPTYYPAAFPQVKAHYQAVARLGLPILFYHFPDCTHLVLTPRQVAEICMLEGIAGMKASIVDLRAFKSYLRRISKPAFHAFTGVTYLFRPALESGASGLICPISAIFPEAAVGFYEAWKKGDAAAARAHETSLWKTLPLMSGSEAPWQALSLGFQIVSKTGIPVPARGGDSPAVFKEVLRLRGLPIRPLVRRPLRQLNSAEAARAKRTWQEIQKNGVMDT